jgi:hypothetical protein
MISELKARILLADKGDDSDNIRQAALRKKIK